MKHSTMHLGFAHHMTTFSPSVKRERHEFPLMDELNGIHGMENMLTQSCLKLGIFKLTSKSSLCIMLHSSSEIRLPSQLISCVSERSWTYHF